MKSANLIRPWFLTSALLVFAQEETGGGLRFEGLNTSASKG